MAFSDLPPEERFMAAAHLRRNVFLTGMAGTGKSTLLRQFIGEASQKVDLTATTGIAALNLGGMTIHRYCGMLLGPMNGQTDEDYLAALRQSRYPSVKAGFARVRAAECVVIDEVSMMPGRQLDFVDYLFRRLRECDEPFGGVQIIASGDFLQLPPVRIGEGAYDWSFTSRAWEAAGFDSVLLRTVRRQDETRFVELLANFRRGSCRGEDASILQGRIPRHPRANLTRLLTHNLQVDKWNNFQLGELAGEAVMLRAVEDGPEHQLEFLKKNLLTPAVLTLKRGCRVMFTINKATMGQREPMFVNGQTGKVVEANAAEVVVERDGDGRHIGMGTFTWRFGKNDGDATFTQFPLRLAYAMTIHKSQGLTLDEALIDIGAAREPGQAYVAVSRVRRLNGLNFRGWFKGIVFSPQAVNYYEGLKGNHKA